MRSATRMQVISLVEKTELYRDLSIAPDLLHRENRWDEAVAEPLEHWIETIARERITDGLYTLGEPYSPQSAAETVRQMTVEKLAQQWRLIGELHFGEAPPLEQARALAREWVERRLRGESAQALLDSLIAPELRVRIGAPQSPDQSPGKASAARGFAAVSAGNPPSRGPGPGSEMPLDRDTEFRLTQAVNELRTLLERIDQYYTALRSGAQLELAALRKGLAGGYVAPAGGGDPIQNPAALPTGRNMTAIDAEKTPTVAAWTVGRQLAEDLLRRYQLEHGVPPKKVAFTLWPSSFIHSQGATLAQIFYLLGVEPVWDASGRVQSVRLIDPEVLGRPRVDVVVQTAGQFRDLAASRLALLERAVALAAEADDGRGNYVAEGVRTTEKYLLDKGLSPLQARRLSTLRSFGGLNGAYGTGIIKMVEDAGAWGDSAALAEQYLVNMGAHYGSGGAWGDYTEHLFAAALQNTDVVVQPRSSSTWGPLSLDHVFEFMGGLSGAVKAVTGKKPDGYFNDFREPARPRLASLQESLWLEARTTLLNPKFISGLTRGGASSAETLAESLRNTFGWEALNPGTVEPRLWQQLFDVYIADIYGLGLEAFFARENPYALQELTGVMLEGARRGFWQPSEEQLSAMAELHGRFVVEHGAGCGPYTCGNPELEKFIASVLGDEIREAYSNQLARVTDTGGRTLVLKLKNKKDFPQKVSLEKERHPADSAHTDPPGESGTGAVSSEWSSSDGTLLELLVLLALASAVAVVILWRHRRAGL